MYSKTLRKTDNNSLCSDSLLFHRSAVVSWRRGRYYYERIAFLTRHGLVLHFCECVRNSTIAYFNPKYENEMNVVVVVVVDNDRRDSPMDTPITQSDKRTRTARITKIKSAALLFISPRWRLTLNCTRALSVHAYRSRTNIYVIKGRAGHRRPCLLFIF